MAHLHLRADSHFHANLAGARRGAREPFKGCQRNTEPIAAAIMRDGQGAAEMLYGDGRPVWM